MVTLAKKTTKKANLEERVIPAVVSYVSQLLLSRGLHIRVFQKPDGDARIDYGTEPGDWGGRERTFPHAVSILSENQFAFVTVDNITIDGLTISSDDFVNTKKFADKIVKVLDKMSTDQGSAGRLQR